MDVSTGDSETNCHWMNLQQRLNSIPKVNVRSTGNLDVIITFFGITDLPSNRIDRFFRIFHIVHRLTFEGGLRDGKRRFPITIWSLNSVRNLTPAYPRENNFLRQTPPNRRCFL